LSRYPPERMTAEIAERGAERAEKYAG